MFVAKILLSVPVELLESCRLSTYLVLGFIPTCISLFFSFPRLPHEQFAILPHISVKTVKLVQDMVNQVIAFDFMAPQHLPRDYFNPKASSWVVHYSMQRTWWYPKYHSMSTPWDSTQYRSFQYGTATTSITPQLPTGFLHYHSTPNGGPITAAHPIFNVHIMRLVISLWVGMVGI